MRPSLARPARRLRFARLALVYWTTVFPTAVWELRRWRCRAERILDDVLRRCALDALDSKAWNPQGAAAFAVLARPRHRLAVVRALVIFQLAYDYLDTLSEQPGATTRANAWQLHRALVAVFIPDRDPPSSYYRHHPHDADGGYLASLLGTCRAAFIHLPSHACVVGPLAVHAGRIAEYQALNAHPDERTFGNWARTLTPPQPGLRWWELAAAAGSSLVIHALIAAASHPDLRGRDIDRIQAAYVPWIGGLHTLLDSLVDHHEDMSAGSHSFVAHYASAGETATRLGTLAKRSIELAAHLRDGDRHLLIVAAMSSYYLSAPEAQHPHACAATRGILAALGTPGRLAMHVFRLLRTLSVGGQSASLREGHGRHSDVAGHTNTSRFRS